MRQSPITLGLVGNKRGLSVVVVVVVVLLVVVVVRLVVVVLLVVVVVDLVVVEVWVSLLKSRVSSIWSINAVPATDTQPLNGSP